MSLQVVHLRTTLERVYRVKRLADLLDCEWEHQSSRLVSEQAIVDTESGETVEIVPLALTVAENSAEAFAQAYARIQEARRKLLADREAPREEPVAAGAEE